jgi:hypothetical protein
MRGSTPPHASHATVMHRVKDWTHRWASPHPAISLCLCSRRPGIRLRWRVMRIRGRRVHWGSVIGARDGWMSWIARHAMHRFHGEFGELRRLVIALRVVAIVWDMGGGRRDVGGLLLKHRMLLLVWRIGIRWWLDGGE